jgi:hypothetical protein
VLFPEVGTIAWDSAFGTFVQVFDARPIGTVLRPHIVGKGSDGAETCREPAPAMFATGATLMVRRSAEYEMRSKQ